MLNTIPTIGSYWTIILTKIFFFIFYSNFTFFMPLFVLLLLMVFAKYISKFTSERRFKEFSFFIFFLIFLFYFFIFILLSKNLNISPFFYTEIIHLKSFNIGLTLGFDNLNLLFVTLISFIFFLCVLINWNYSKHDFVFFVTTASILQMLLILAFTTFNFFFFFFFFEASLIPMYFIINNWGSRQRKVHAAYYFFLYTIFGSIFLLIGIISLLSNVGSLDINILMSSFISCDRQIIIWLLLFIGFSIKLPMPPFHLWLPEAHVEAPAAGSIILAGILLKLGSYGILRFMIPLFDYANFYYITFVFTVCSLSLIYISLIAIRQTDLKKIIAYSSIAHMSIITLGLFSNSPEGISGSIFFMISHGLVSAGLFIIIGILYERFHTRSILYFNNISSSMPVLAVFLFIFILANMGFPLTSGFIGEFIIFTYINNINYIVSVVCVLSTILTSVYSIWLYTRIIFSNNNNSSNFFIYRDLDSREFFTCFFISIFIILLGIYPNIILDKVYIYSFLYAR